MKTNVVHKQDNTNKILIYLRKNVFMRPKMVKKNINVIFSLGSVLPKNFFHNLEKKIKAFDSLFHCSSFKTNFWSKLITWNRRNFVSWLCSLQHSRVLIIFLFLKNKFAFHPFWVKTMFLIVSYSISINFRNFSIYGNLFIDLPLKIPRIKMNSSGASSQRRKLCSLLLVPINIIQESFSILAQQICI